MFQLVLDHRFYRYWFFGNSFSQSKETKIKCMAEGDNISNFICQDDTDVALVSSPVGVPFLEDSSSDTSENRYVPSSRAQYLSHYFRLAFQCSYLSWMAVIIVILMSVVAILVGEVVSTRRSDDLDRFFYCRTISGKRIFETSNVRDIRIEVLESSIAGAYIITAITSIILALILQRKKHQARRGDASAGKVFHFSNSFAVEFISNSPWDYITHL